MQPASAQPVDDESPRDESATPDPAATNPAATGPSATGPVVPIVAASPVLAVAATLTALFVLVVALKALAPLLQPFVIAGFFFYLGRPMANALSRRGVPRFVSNYAMLLLVAAFLGGAGWLVGAHLDDLASKAPVYNAKLGGLFEQTKAWIAAHLPGRAQELQQAIAQLRLTSGPLTTVARLLVETFVGGPGTALLILIYLLFMNEEAATFAGRLQAAYGPRRAERMLTVGNRINAGIIRYTYVKGVASLLVAALSTVALTLFEVDLALLWGTLLFLGNFVPYIGSLVAVLLPLLVYLLQHGSIAWTAFLAVILVATQVAVSNILEPKMAGRALDLSPLMVMVTLAFWGWCWGIVGLVLAVPILMAVKQVLENIPATAHLAILLGQLPAKR